MGRLKLIATTLLFALALSGESPDNAKSINIELVTGGHDHNVSFYRLFDDPGFDVNVNPHPSAYQIEIRPAVDVLVLYDLADVDTEKKRANLRKFVESGKGVVVLHHALADNADWPWWYEEVVGGRYLMKADGSTPASTFKHDLDLKITKVADHPVTHGLVNFDIYDEAYGKIWVSPKAKVLLETKHPESQGPVAWISPYPRARVVYIQLGHGREAHENPVYRKLVRNAIFWAAGANQ